MSVVAMRPRPADSASHRPKFDWLAAGRVRRRWVAAVFAVCTVFASATAVVSAYSLHRIWGVAAAGAYGLAALAVVAWRSRGVDLALFIAISGAVVGPLAWMATTGQSQPEVAVISRSADMLVTHGDPYHTQAQIAPTHDPNSYNPYLPALTVFGLPSAVHWPGLLSDPRLWFGLCFAAALLFALVRARAPDPGRWTAFIIATPAIALPIAVGGTDLPVLALICLSLAFLRAEPRPVAAGVALAASLVLRPPMDARAAALRLALGLALMFTLAPATRFGYFSYPVALLVWLWLAGPERKPAPVDATAGAGTAALAGAASNAGA